MEWTASSMVSASRSLALFLFWILSILFTTALSSCSNSTEHYYPYQPDQKAMASLLTSCRKFILSGSILYMILHWDTDSKREHSKTRREHSHAHISSLLNCHQSIATNDSILSWEKTPKHRDFRCAEALDPIPTTHDLRQKQIHLRLPGTPPPLLIKIHD